ncbi:phosphate ABC transporter substrate-binding protein (PhoT family) [Mucilaginibacter gracilis]|uniref:Phosphate ABC transporter substrate-binding protein (PhoT family) n=2 Tax=Mucilaginibacter gracilis TaxID=423350 RepID=A0A495J7U6_9SPHI|nr:phosphate ABC transporter substrate-binding protein (PhoT family) [Mucilaginibacter gracilis]
MKYLLCLLIILLVSCSDAGKFIKVKGSDTEVNLAVSLAENFYKEHPDFSVAISGGGSGLGIASLLNGQTDIANSSRPLNAEEIMLLKTKGIPIRTVIFAEDATAFIVHKDFHLDSIDIATLTKVLNGQYKTWKPVTGQDMPISIYGRQSNSGTHSFISKKLKMEFSRDAKEMNGNAQIVEGIKHDRSGIGYVGAGYILNNGTEQPIKVLKIIAKPGSIAVSPLDIKAIAARRYYFQRPLYQFIPLTSWKKVSAFIDFEKSAAGQKIITTSGYYIILK